MRSMTSLAFLVDVPKHWTEVDLNLGASQDSLEPWEPLEARPVLSSLQVDWEPFELLEVRLLLPLLLLQEDFDPLEVRSLLLQVDLRPLEVCSVLLPLDREEE